VDGRQFAEEVASRGHRANERLALVDFAVLGLRRPLSPP
jgi:hypothetical protein